MSDACTQIMIRSLTALLCTTENVAPIDVLYKVDAVYRVGRVGRQFFLFFVFTGRISFKI